MRLSGHHGPEGTVAVALGEFRSAQHEGCQVSRPAALNANTGAHSAEAA
jgi:hypothetical protein